MTITAIKRVLFEEASASSDWRFPYRLIIPAMAGWTIHDEVVLGMSPDFAMWDDYGIRSRTFPPATSDSVAPFWQASSKDSSGVVTLVDPNAIDIIVPWNVIRNIGPGMCNVAVQYRNDTGARTSLIAGRLPLVMTGI